ncbi:saccharopine dehydrogenase-like protein [Collimonas sp. PA-H2]|uniref:saccharopine dehydrogenase family protein n=1 Tax=Collimonas sp. PA-H2 TaxID=1881062 RepID=UPI000BF4A911|nr:saccharopine dehydrogenase NADP-binding domain-containing protein [Collimonas sp. PA-H2]PFH10401.1 saccharopine dehydrogenase-like protein [Collimonas sp. PA-H2]
MNSNNTDTAIYKVLLIGGYGFFGKKLAERLALDPLLHVMLAGRDLSAAQALADSLNQLTPPARFSALRIDVQDAQLAACIEASGANAVIHTSGPFQGQGYDVARACIAAGAHYVDLADGRDFVSGITALDASARQADVLVTSGASSVPALSSAVVDQLAADFRELHDIAIGISPGNRTERGLATVRAILGYCGASFLQWSDGRWQPVVGWQGLRRQRYQQPVGNRWLANCDVPDLQLFPARYPGVRNISFGAGLELPVLHFGVWLMAGMRRLGLVHNWSRYAAMLKRLSDLFIRFGSDAGAMHVEVTGVGADGTQQHRRWTLIAAEGDGPYVPTLASAALVGKLARRLIDRRGACPCIGMLTLQDFSAAMQGLAITTETTAT